MPGCYLHHDGAHVKVAAFVMVYYGCVNTKILFLRICWYTLYEHSTSSALTVGVVLLRG